MPSQQIFAPAALNSQGLNLQAVFNIEQLPAPLRQQLGELVEALTDYKQLILIAHGGRDMWNALDEHAWRAEQPIDQASSANIRRWFKHNYPTKAHRLVYPSHAPINLQALGELAGWHNPSPFLVGINHTWGSWFAYRAVLLTDTDFAQTASEKGQSPCTSCQRKPCIERCPAQACGLDTFNMTACMSYRQTENSKCQHTCLAREACPVAKPQQYSQQQMQYHYGVSMRMIKDS